MPILDVLKNLFGGKEEAEEERIEEKEVEKAELEIDEEDKIVVALAASIMASEDRPNSNLHISKITRIK